MVPSALSGDHPTNEAIAAELARLAPLYDFTPLSGLTLRSGAETVLVDHAIVDRWGILAISSLACGNAFVRGSDSDTRWTVRFGDGTISTLVNPLLTLRKVEATLRDIAKDSRNPLEADYVKSAVVFEQCNLDGVELGPFDRERVVTIAGIESLLKLRHDFSPNPGDIDAGVRTALVMALRAADAGVVSAAPSPWAVDHDAAAISERAMTQATRRAVASAAVVDAPRKRSTLGHNIFYVVSRVTPVLIAALMWWWVMYGGGMDLVVAKVEGMTVPEDGAFSVTAADPTSHQVVDNIPVVVERMRKDAPPEVVKAIHQPEQPRIARSANNIVVYTWTYQDAKGASKTYSIRTTLEGEILSVGAK